MAHKFKIGDMATIINKLDVRYRLRGKITHLVGTQATLTIDGKSVRVETKNLAPSYTFDGLAVGDIIDMGTYKREVLEVSRNTYIYSCSGGGFNEGDVHVQSLKILKDILNSVHVKIVVPENDGVGFGWGFAVGVLVCIIISVVKSHIS